MIASITRRVLAVILIFCAANSLASRPQLTLKLKEKNDGTQTAVIIAALKRADVTLNYAVTVKLSSGGNLIAEKQVQVGPSNPLHEEMTEQEVLTVELNIAESTVNVKYKRFGLELFKQYDAHVEIKDAQVNSVVAFLLGNATSSFVTISCDPTNPVAFCGPDTHCVFSSDDGDPMTTICEGATGGGDLLSDCTDNSDCASGLLCINTGDPSNKCLQVCDAAGTSDDCPIGLSCFGTNPPTIVGSTEYGFCI